MIEDHLVCLDLLGQLGPEVFRAHREKEEIQDCKAKKVPKDHLVCKVLLDLWDQGVKGVKGEAQDNLAHLELEEGLETRVHLGQQVQWVSQEPQDFQDHRAKLAQLDLLGREAREVLQAHLVLLDHLV